MFSILTYFLSIAENLNLHQVGKEIQLFLKNAFPCKFHGIKIVPTSEAEIKSIILSIKSKNSSGYDKITTKILKACASLISQPLSHIYNNLLHIGVFPDHLNISTGKPLFKKGDKTSMTNCRPISLLTVFSKVLEKVMYNRLSHHMHTNNICPRTIWLQAREIYRQC
jgi:sarcosine oxidase/L-pipecolate oxidase